MKRRLAAALSLLFLAPVAAGCTQLPLADESYKEKIPAALDAADLGLTDIWADSSLSGFTETLSVGATLASPDGSSGSLLDDDAEAAVSDDLVARIIEIAMSERTVSMSNFALTLYNEDHEFYDLDPVLVRLGADPIGAFGSGVISMDEAERIAEGAGR